MNDPIPVPVPEHPAPRLARLWKPLASLVTIFLIGALITANVADRRAIASQPANVEVITIGNTADVLDHAVNGTWLVVIPLGTQERMIKTGIDEYQLPSVVRLHVGDTIVIRNEDIYPHAILDAFLLPGQSETRTLTKPGSEIYSAGCSVVSVAATGFTSIFIAPAE